MSAADLQQEVTLSLRDRVISVPLRSMLHCGKYASSELFECEVAMGKEADVGGLLWDFDPSFCGSGVEWEEGQGGWEYCYSHVVLLLLQALLLVCLAREDRVANLVNGALGLKTS